MVEGEQRLCLVEPTLEIMEEVPLQVQMQPLGAMEGGEVLAAVAVAVAVVESAHRLPLIINQEEMEAVVELVVMEAAAEAEVWEGALLLKTKILQEQEVQEVLAVLEEAAAAAEVLGTLAEEIMVVMVQQEVMAEEEGVEVLLVFLAKLEVLVAAALAALD